MPYISKKLRDVVDDKIDRLINIIDHDVSDDSLNGVLNYTVTRILEGSMKGEIRYNKINNLVGVLECVKLEMCNRIAAPYEKIKAMENGDIPETEQLLKNLP